MKLDNGTALQEIQKSLQKAGFIDISGRDSGIRTHDPYSPRVVRYQAALCPDDEH